MAYVAGIDSRVENRRSSGAVKEVTIAIWQPSDFLWQSLALPLCRFQLTGRSGLLCIITTNVFPKRVPAKSFVKWRYNISCIKDELTCSLSSVTPVIAAKSAPISWCDRYILNRLVSIALAVTDHQTFQEPDVVRSRANLEWTYSPRPISSRYHWGSQYQ